MARTKPDNLQLEEVAGRRGVRHRLKRIEKASVMHAHNFIVRRWSNLKQVRRRALLWLMIAGTLTAVGWFQTTAQQPLYSHEDVADGGTYIEGSIGRIETLNPIFATDTAERGLSSMLFSGLVRVDDGGGIVGDLAESWEVKNGGKSYIFTLRPGIRWSDGTPITSKDVAYTIDTIQSPLARSPLLSAWNNIGVTAKDERTVEFTLKVPYAPFMNTLTVGILPSHILSNITLQQLRNAAFNTDPSVVSGPFSFRGIVTGRGGIRSQTDVYLARNDTYHLGRVKLDRFSMRVYEDVDDLITAMRDREIMAASDIPSNAIEQFTNQSGLKTTKMRPFSGVFAFFKTSTPLMSDKNVRQALRFATDTAAVANVVGSEEPMQGPLLAGQLGFSPRLKQPVNNMQQAERLLDKAGWRKNADGKRVKKGQPLTVRLVSLNSGEHGVATRTLQQQWSKLGVNVEVSLVQKEDFQSNVLTPHAYDVLVYELSIGRDSDVYPFWHSSQGEPGRLNLSEYKSSIVDDNLDSARTVNANALRQVKYRTFVEEWINDAPAIALYRPNLYYVQLAKTRSVEPGEVGDALERFSNIRYWTAEMTRVDNTR